VDDSGGRRRCGDDERHGEAAALCGAANGDGGWRDNWGRQRAGWRGNRGRPRLPWPAVGGLAWQPREAAATLASSRRRRWVGTQRGTGAGGGWAAIGGGAATGGGRPTVFRRRACGTVVRGRERLFGREKLRRKRIVDCWPGGYFE
jgi:hypothetical protein